MKELTSFHWFPHLQAKMQPYFLKNHFVYLDFQNFNTLYQQATPLDYHRLPNTLIRRFLKSFYNHLSLSKSEIATPSSGFFNSSILELKS